MSSTGTSRAPVARDPSSRSSLGSGSRCNIRGSRRIFGWRGEPDYARRLNLLLDAYGLQDRHGFLIDVIARIAYNRDHIQRRADQGIESYVRLVNGGHIAGMNMAIEFLADEIVELSRFDALRGPASPWLR